jgi:hypothetical protein
VPENIKMAHSVGQFKRLYNSTPGKPAAAGAEQVGGGTSDASGR